MRIFLVLMATTALAACGGRRRANSGRYGSRAVDRHRNRRGDGDTAHICRTNRDQNLSGAGRGSSI